MRLIKKRGPFSTIDIFLEEIELEEIYALTKKHDRVSLLLHHPMDLPHGFRLRQKKTPNIYLDKSLEEVFGAFRDTVRNEIRRTERLSEFEIRFSEHAPENAYAMYREFEFAQHRVPISRDEFSFYSCVTAFYKHRPISAITFFESEGCIRVRSIFSARLTAKGLDEDLYKVIGFSSKRLVYEICKYGHARGIRCVDLASINLTDPSKEPIARFKSGFGARIEDEYQYVWTSQIFFLVQWALACRIWLRKRAHAVAEIFLPHT